MKKWQRQPPFKTRALIQCFALSVTVAVTGSRSQLEIFKDQVSPKPWSINYI